MARLNISLLGSFQVSFDEAQITNFESNKVRALLAYLAVESSQPHSRDKLTALFWPDMPSRRAKSNLSSALYNLRGLISDHLVRPAYLLRTRDTVQFNPHSDYLLDVDRFSADINGDRARQPSHQQTEPGSLERMEAAVARYRGDFLDGLSFDSSLAFDEWVMIVRQRLQRQVLTGLHLLSDYYSEQGELPQALSFTWRQVELDPLDERACRQLMTLLCDNDQRNQALTQYERLQVMLAEELGIEPERETIALRDRIRDLDPITVKGRSRGDNLPGFLTALIGRQAELSDLRTLILDPDCRLLTILGPGGSGKTRLALEVTRSSLGDFSHGVFFVPLNPLLSPESILPAIADALELPRGERDDIQILLSNYLRKKNILLLLDGFEHLLDGTHLLAEMLRQAHDIKILVTSRTRLNIRGEHLYSLAGMKTPKNEATEEEILNSDAVQMLVTSLQRMRPEYKPVPEEIHDLHQICQKVQGMPLGILLAASWGATLGVDVISQEVSRGLDFLAADWADVPTRQRSLRATFDYTWGLLNAREKTIFQSLSVFRGDFTRRAAQKVSEASPYEMRNLMERSLLLSKLPGWYEVHELLRQFGREKLAQSIQEERAVCGSHSDYYLGQLKRLGADLKGSKQVPTLRNIELEHENYRAAWNWAASQGAAAKLASALDSLCLYYDLSLRYLDGESACQAAIHGLKIDQVDPDVCLVRARLCIWLCRFTRLLGQPEIASKWIKKAQNCIEKVKSDGYHPRAVEAFLLLELGNDHFNNDRVAAAAYYEHSLRVYRGLKDDWGTAKVLGRLGSLAHHTGSFQVAVQQYAESLALYRVLGEPRGIANALIELGHNTLRQGHVSAGQGYIQEGITTLQQIGDRAGVAQSYFQLGRSCFWSGQFSKGNSLLMKSFPILEDLGMRQQLVFGTTALSLGQSHNGEYAEAIAQALQGLAMAKEIDARREIGMAYLLLGMANLGQGNIKQTQAWALKGIDKYQEIDQRDELAWALALMVFVHRALGRTDSAASYLSQTLEISVEIQGYYPVLCGLYGGALLLLNQGDIERAVDLAALSLRFPVVSNSQWFEDVAGREIAAAAQSLPPEAFAAAQQRGRQRDIWETAEELLGEYSEKAFQENS